MNAKATHQMITATRSRCGRTLAANGTGPACGSCARLGAPADRPAAPAKTAPAKAAPATTTEERMITQAMAAYAEPRDEIALAQVETARREWKRGRLAGEKMITRMAKIAEDAWNRAQAPAKSAPAKAPAKSAPAKLAPSVSPKQAAQMAERCAKWITEFEQAGDETNANVIRRIEQAFRAAEMGLFEAMGEIETTVRRHTRTHHTDAPANTAPANTAPATTTTTKITNPKGQTMTTKIDTTATKIDAEALAAEALAAATRGDYATALAMIAQGRAQEPGFKSGRTTWATMISAIERKQAKAPAKKAAPAPAKKAAPAKAPAKAAPAPAPAKGAPVEDSTVLEILAGSTWNGAALTLPSGWRPWAQYLAVKAAVTPAGGTWDKAAKAFMFADAKAGRAALTAWCESVTGEAFTWASAPKAAPAKAAPKAPAKTAAKARTAEALASAAPVATAAKKAPAKKAPAMAATPEITYTLPAYATSGVSYSAQAKAIRIALNAAKVRAHVTHGADRRVITVALADATQAGPADAIVTKTVKGIAVGIVVNA